MKTGLSYHWNRWRSEDGSVWLSEDPARDGVNWYGYCGHNPVKYTDPDGREVLNANTTLFMSSGGTETLGYSDELIADVGCVLTSYTRIASALAGCDISLSESNKYAKEHNLFSGDEQNLLTSEAGAQLINGLLLENGITDVSVELYIRGGNVDGIESSSIAFFNYMDNVSTEFFATARIETTDKSGENKYGHHVNVNHGAFFQDVDSDSLFNLNISDTSGVRNKLYNDTRKNTLERVDYFKVIRNQSSGEEN